MTGITFGLVPTEPGGEADEDWLVLVGTAELGYLYRCDHPPHYVVGLGHPGEKMQHFSDHATKLAALQCIDLTLAEMDREPLSTFRE